MTMAVITLAMAGIVGLAILKIRAERQARFDRALREHVRRELLRGGSK